MGRISGRCWSLREVRPVLPIVFAWDERSGGVGLFGVINGLGGASLYLRSLFEEKNSRLSQFLWARIEFPKC